MTMASCTPSVVATTNDGVLPLDLLYDILLRLPAETICRFRAICRSWRDLLCHPDFVAAARNPGPLIAIGMCNHNYTSEVNVVDLESGDAIKRVKLGTVALTCDLHLHLHSGFLSVGAISHDRLVCVADVYHRHHLLDLTSGVVSLLPDHKPSPQEGFTYTICTVGRAASTREHKLLAVITSNSQHERQVCKILTLGNEGGGWRDTCHPPLNVEWQTSSCTVINGIAYFLSDYSDSMEPHAQRHKIMAFNFDSEAWLPAEASIQGPGKHRCICLAEMDCHLVADRITSCEIELWFLVDSDMSYWSKRYTISMVCHQNHGRFNEHFVKPLAVLDDGRIVLWMRVAGVGTGNENNMMRIYNPRTKTFTDGTRVSSCRSVSAFKWNLLHSGQRGAIDVAAKSLLINRRRHQSRAPTSIEGSNKEPSTRDLI